METQRLWLDWSHVFSNRRIATQYAQFQELRNTSKCRNRTLPPLTIVPLHNEKSVLEFSNAAKLIDMSLFIWFVIFLRGTKTEEIDYCYNPPGNLFNVAFNVRLLVICDGDNIVREWYAVYRNETRMMDLAVWKFERDYFTLTEKTLHERRNDMKGISLRAIYIQKDPYVVGNKSNVRGFFVQIMKELSEVLNFKLHIVAEASLYGNWNKTTKNWTGAVGSIIRGEADIGIGDFSMSASRLRSVDYTVPLFLSSDCLILKSDAFNIQWTAFFKPFSFRIWLSIIGVILIAPLVLTFLRIGDHYQWDQTVRSKRNRWMYIISDHYLYVWGIFCQQGLSEVSRQFSVRLAYFWIFVCSFMISAAYSGALISFMTIKIPVKPFTSMEEFVNDGTYKLITEQASAEYDFFSTTNESVFKKAMDLMEKPDKLPRTNVEAFQRVCSHEKVAYYTSGLPARRIPCAVICVPCGRTDSSAMIINKQSPFRTLINYRLEKFFNNGVVNRHKRILLRRNITYGAKYESVTFTSIAPLTIILGGGFILSIFIIITEKYAKKIMSHL